VEAIAGTPVSEVRAQVDTLFAGNEPWHAYMSSFTLTSPEILQGVRITAGETSTWTFRCGDRRVQRPLAALPLSSEEASVEAWRDLSPAYTGPGGPWVTALRGPQARLPAYLRHPGRHYWVERLRGRKALYVQYNRALNMPGGRTLAAFADEVAGEARGGRLDTVVVDLRFNTGGDLTAGRPLMERIRDLADAAGADVVVITGRATFSAGLFHAAQWRQWGAILVGEAPGDALDFWAEGGAIVLPNSGLTLRYADALHAYSRAPHPDVRAFVELDVPDLQPDEPIVPSWRDYLEGGDAALESALTLRPEIQTDSRDRVFRTSARGSAASTRKSAQAPGRSVPRAGAAFMQRAASPVAARRTCRGLSPALAISSSSRCSK
jgi:hypothetical protein